MTEVLGTDESISDGVIDSNMVSTDTHILVVDDSLVARNQVKRVLDQLQVECTLAKDGVDALEKLESWHADGKVIPDFLSMIISDVEMPRMDGYTLTTKIRKEPAFKDVHIILHTSLSGVFNQNMIEKVGADKFLAKYKPDELASIVQQRLKEHQKGQDIAA